MNPQKTYFWHRAARNNGGHWLGLLALCLTAIASPSALAAPSEAVIEQVQQQAWVEQNGVRSPVVAGQVIKAPQQLITGDGARLVIRLADGSAVKLGEHAQLRITSLDKSEQGVLMASLDVVKGAFRFSTGLFKKILSQRSIKVRFPTVTIGVRGTDFWGKASLQHEMVLLLEGSVELTRHASIANRSILEKRSLSQPTTYVFTKAGNPLQEAQADSEEITGWAKETEPDPVVPNTSR